jgi:hypothetical protein
MPVCVPKYLPNCCQALEVVSDIQFPGYAHGTMELHGFFADLSAGYSYLVFD